MTETKVGLQPGKRLLLYLRRAVALRHITLQGRQIRRLNHSAICIPPNCYTSTFDCVSTSLQAMEALNEGIPTIVTWLQRFRCSKIRPEAPRIKTRRRNGDEVEEGFCIEAVTDIEESIWAPKYGIKGIIDASIDIAFEGPMDVVSPLTGAGLSTLQYKHAACTALRMQAQKLPGNRRCNTTQCVARGGVNPKP